MDIVSISNYVKPVIKKIGPEDLGTVKEKFGFDKEKSFVIPEEVVKTYQEIKKNGQQSEKDWTKIWEKYETDFPKEAKEIQRRFNSELPENWKQSLPTYTPNDPPKATRQFGQIVINKMAEIIPELMGGSADLNPSTLTYLNCSTDFQKQSYQGRNIRYGVREHGMAAISNGIQAYGASLAYCSTFFNFIGYALGAVRLSAISELGVIYIMTHDSIGLGEDGPTHQPIGSLMMIRTMPNILMIRPGDGNEVSGAYSVAIESRKTPTVIALSRQAMPNLEGTSIEGVYNGAYVIFGETKSAEIIFVGSGSELSLCVETAKLYEGKAAVVSMPCWELFEQKDLDYKCSVFPEGIPVLSVEAGSSTGWREYSHSCVGLSTFGASGPLKNVLSHFGFNTENVLEKGKKLVEFYKGKSVPLIITPF